MPYIKKERRERLEGAISNLIAFLQEIPEEDRDGEINYIVTALLKRIYQPLRYKRINRAIGVLECIKQEYYRIVASPYEEKKRQEAGDVN